MAVATPQFAELLWPGIQKIFGDTYKDYPTIWTQLCDQVNSDKEFEKYQGITEYGLAAVKPQGGDIAYQDPSQGFQKQISNVGYAAGSTIT